MCNGANHTPTSPYVYILHSQTNTDSPPLQYYKVLHEQDFQEQKTDFKQIQENGDLVVVKVQRPFVLETVTIYLFIICKLGVALRRFPQIATDVVGLVDEWAARFFEELDYVKEGQNGTRFAYLFWMIFLRWVVVPKTYSKYTSRRVLTTQWIDGEKLSQSTADDVGDLVNVGVICYLK
ncbi:hypothetical protein L7F22_059256 [Adiantum nelumboides]|nr:hypothetical protein [Adiantum nelumboides]